MAQKIEKVKAGDLITASFMNHLITHLEDLEERVAALEAADPTPTGVKITGFEFSKDPLRVGDRLKVKGKNFSVPAELNQVTIGAVKVQTFALDSGDEQLAFDVPEIPGLAADGSKVTVIVTNPNGTASDSVKVSPKMIKPTGHIEVTYVIGPVMPQGHPNIEAASSYIFTFDVKAFASEQGDYTLTPSVINVQNWTAELLQDNGDTVRPSNVITLPGNPSTGVSKNIRVRVKVPAGQTIGTKATVRLVVKENTQDTGVVPGNAQFELAVGSPPPTPEKRVRILLESAQGAARIDAAQNKVIFKRGGGPGVVGLSLDFSVGGNFSVTAAVKNTTGWTGGDIDIPSFKVSAPAEGKTTRQTILAEFAAGQAAAETEMYVSIKGDQGVDIKYAQTIGVE